MTVLLKNKVSDAAQTFQTFRVVSDDWAMTTVHVACYKKYSVQPRLVLFDEETYLLDWCKQNSVRDALVGGFFIREQSKPLGELWLKGERQDTVPFMQPWDQSRASLHINGDGEIAIAPRYLFCTAAAE